MMRESRVRERLGERCGERLLWILRCTVEVQRSGDASPYSHSLLLDVFGSRTDRGWVVGWLDTSALFCPRSRDRGREGVAECAHAGFPFGALREMVKASYGWRRGGTRLGGLE